MFEVGQKVWDVVRGEGVVTRIHSNQDYPVIVDFDCRDSESYTSDGKHMQEHGNPSLYPYQVEVVRKVTKPSINWEHVAPEFNYLAEDSGGGAFLFEEKPFIASDASAWCAQSDEVVDAIGFASYAPGTCDWKDSLVARPKKDA